MVQHMLENALADNQLNYSFVKSYLRATSDFNGDVCLGRKGPFGNYYIFLGDFTGHGLAPHRALPVAQAFLAWLNVAYRLAIWRPNLIIDFTKCCRTYVLCSYSGRNVGKW